MFTNCCPQIWDNITKSDAELAHKRLIGICWLFAVCFINTVPLLVISVLANLGSVCQLFGSFYFDRPAESRNRLKHMCPSLKRGSKRPLKHLHLHLVCYLPLCPDSSVSSCLSSCVGWPRYGVLNLTCYCNVD